MYIKTEGCKPYYVCFFRKVTGFCQNDVATSFRSSNDATTASSGRWGEIYTLLNRFLKHAFTNRQMILHTYGLPPRVLMISEITSQLFWNDILHCFKFIQNSSLSMEYIGHSMNKWYSSSILLSEQSWHFLFSIAVFGLVYRPASISSRCALILSLVKFFRSAGGVHKM